MFRLQSETRGEQTALIDEMVGNQKVVQAFSIMRMKRLEQFDEINERLQKYSLRAIFFSFITNPCTRFVNSLVYAGSWHWQEHFRVISTNGGIVCWQSVLLFKLMPTSTPSRLMRFPVLLRNFRMRLACAARIFELIEEPAEDTG